jgi:hypothetical protein
MDRPAKYDPGAYTVLVFDSVGRRKGARTRSSLTAARALAARWIGVTRGSAVVLRCVWNSAIPSESWAVRRG